MASNLHVTESVWLPDRATAGLAPNVNTRPVVEQELVPAAHVATVPKLAALSVPDVPVALVQLAAFHVTSDADQVALGAGGVKDAAAV